MAMNGPGMANEVLDAMEGLGLVPRGVLTGDQAVKTWTAACGAIVAHIQNNAETTTVVSGGGSYGGDPAAPGVIS